MTTNTATVNRADGKVSFVQLRVNASDSSAFVSCGAVPNGTSVQVLSEEGNFFKIKLPPAFGQSFVGFVKKQYIVLGAAGDRGHACITTPSPCNRMQQTAICRNFTLHQEVSFLTLARQCVPRFSLCVFVTT